MDTRPLRSLIGLTAIGAATAVGITTHDAGFTALTFIGTLLVPRVLGISGGHRRKACRGSHGPGGRHERMREQLERRLETWHRDAHGDAAPDSTAAGSPASA